MKIKKKKTRKTLNKSKSRRKSKRSRQNIPVSRRIDNLNKLLEERTPSPSFEPPNPVDYFNSTMKSKKMNKSKTKKSSRIVQSMVNNYNPKYTKTDSKLKESIQREMKMSLSQAKQQFAEKMRKEETGARWRGQGSVALKSRREATMNSKRKMQTKSVIKTRRPKKKQISRTVYKTVDFFGCFLYGFWIFLTVFEI